MIDASAGTGKTYTITYLVLRLLLGSGGDKGFGKALNIDELLVVTFTDAAASDLRQRVREKIRTARIAFERLLAKDLEDPLSLSLEPQLVTLIQEMTHCSNLAQVKEGEACKKALVCIRRLNAAERSIDEAAICTIHSFCNRSLNRIYSLEAAEAFDEQMCAPQSVQDLYLRSDHEVWRELFYTQDSRAKSLKDLLNVASPEDPELISFIDKLSKVRITHQELHTPSLCGFAVRGGDAQFFKGSRLHSLPKKLYEYAHNLASKLQKVQDEYIQALNSVSERYVAFNSFAEFSDHQGLNLIEVSKLFKPKKDFVALFDTVFLECASNAPTPAEFLQYAGDKWLDEEVSFDNCIDSRGLKKVRSTQTALLAYTQALEFETLLQSLCRIVKDYQTINETCRQTALCVVAIMLIKNREQTCAKEGKLTFDELLYKLDAALHDDLSENFCKVLRARYPVAIIDEFQDTDPVQFSIFSKLYLEKNAPKKERSICFLIGDPKQSIYRFRGADINSYTEAKNLIQCNEQNRTQNRTQNGDQDSSQDNLQTSVQNSLYTLNVNYRSSYGVVHGVNKIFRGFDEEHVNLDPFFDLEDLTVPLTCPQVQAHEVIAGVDPFYGKLKFVLKKEGNELSSGNFVISDRYPSDAKKRKNSSDAVFLAEAAAQSISEVLTYGYLLDKDGNERRVENKDIAVLVRGKGEYLKIKQALDKLAIPSVYYSDQGSVLNEDIPGNFMGKTRPTECALWIVYFMEACLLFSSRSAVLRLMASPMACLSAEEFSSLSKERGLEEEAELLRRCQSLWRSTGFVAGFSLWLNKHGVLRRLLSAGHERELTDLMQISELIQRQHRLNLALEAQLTWFKRQIQNDQGLDDPDALKHRLESERAQVSIYTIHKSKGLEFPVTILPFLYDAYVADLERFNKSKSEISYDYTLKRRILELDLKDEKVKEEVKKEDLHESARLLYVALTRACAVNFLFMMKDGESVKTGTALMRELVQCAGESSTDTILSMLKNCDPKIFLVQERQRKERDILISERMSHAQSQIVPVVENPSVLKKGTVSADFTVSSFSALASGLHERFAPKGDDNIDLVSASSQDDLNAYTFPRGPDAGTFLHETLQFLDFCSAKNDPEYLAPYLRKAVRDYQGSVLLDMWLKKNSSSTQDPYEALEKWIRDIINCPISYAGENFSLAMLPNNQKFCEMKFLLPSEFAKSSAINDLCVRSADEVYPEHEKLYLSDHFVNGFITGSIDLMFKGQYNSHEAYFVVDYKSTYLGDKTTDYDALALKKSVFDPRNRYDLQYLFYSVALHRYLKTRIKDYDYARDFGGVIYLYLRGMNAKGQGVFYTRPSFEIIDALDQLLSQGENSRADLHSAKEDALEESIEHD